MNDSIVKKMTQFLTSNIGTMPQDPELHNFQQAIDEFSQLVKEGLAEYRGYRLSTTNISELEYNQLDDHSEMKKLRITAP